ncbi:MAG: VWA domain-containing protein, partial [Proteobacteria bacterium]|nr:VWA domain-containing protein [Pseudomonadota bacterium]
FHNCMYETVWQDNRRRHSERIDLHEVLRTYPSDYKVIFVGDATMSPYEITYPGGSVEHWNEEAGAVWMQRVLDTYKHAVWLNPQPMRNWSYTPSIEILSQIMEDRMYPLTLEGLDSAMRELTH